jgi:hypothetical protein
MSDKKISALTAATTPLAGTEVLPVVQSGVTTKVPVSDLTAGRAVATGNLTTTGTATISSDAAIGTTTLNVNANRNTLVMQGVWGGQLDINVGATNYAQFGSDNFDTGSSCRIQSKDSIVFKMNNATADFIQMANGNVVFSTAGKGIDFSATPGTGTSELLADYEEGTWTPALAAAGITGATYSAQVGKYTKIGNTVFVSCKVTLSALTSGGTNYLRITGLPFAIGANSTTAIFSENLIGGVIGRYIVGFAQVGAGSDLNLQEINENGNATPLGMSGTRLTASSSFSFGLMYTV